MIIKNTINNLLRAPFRKIKGKQVTGSEKTQSLSAPMTLQDNTSLSSLSNLEFKKLVIERLQELDTQDADFMEKAVDTFITLSITRGYGEGFYKDSKSSEIIQSIMNEINQSNLLKKKYTTVIHELISPIKK